MPRMRIGLTDKAVSRPDGLIPAAQYLRTSQGFEVSLHTQQNFIGSYAKQNGFVVTTTYCDSGKSGLRLKNRPGLIQLLHDVMETPSYRAILVYDVSRWGRFQDIDEGAHYEFICKSAKVPVHYCHEGCGEQLTPTSSVLKTLRRNMAAEYSRHISVTSATVIMRNARGGFHAAGLAGYALRRQVVSMDGTKGAILKPGQYRTFRSDRLRLVPGPKAEVQCVRRMFKMALAGRTFATIARTLNHLGISGPTGKPWRYSTVGRVLRNLKYTGTSVWNQHPTSGAIHASSESAKPIFVPNAFPAIIDPKTFEKVQDRIRDTRPFPDQEMLDDLREILRKHGTLSWRLIRALRNNIAGSTYWSHFGGLPEIYQKLGIAAPDRLVRHSTTLRKTLKQRESVEGELHSLFEVSSIHCRPYESSSVLHLKDGSYIGLFICRMRVLDTGNRRWRLRRTSFAGHRADLICLMNEKHDAVSQYFLIPPTDIPGAGREYWIAENDPILRCGFKLSYLSQLMEGVSIIPKPAANPRRSNVYSA